VSPERRNDSETASTESTSKGNAKAKKEKKRERERETNLGVLEGGVHLSGGEAGR